jgi:hypothetical protein
MKKLKVILLSLVAPLLFMGMLNQPAGAFSIFAGACQNEAASSPACQQAQNEGGQNNNRVTGPKNIINITANILALATGIGAIIMIIISGFKFVLAGGATPGQRTGDPNAVKSARQTLTASIIGLVVVALAWTIIRFVTDNLIQ